MLGLEKTKVVLTPYEPQWAETFHASRAELLRHVGDLVLSIEHVGSTSVPGMWAKPILDIAVLFRDESMLQKLIVHLSDIEYLYCGDAAQEGGHLFVKCIRPEVRTHHLHCVMLGDPQWERYLRFRDLLRMDEKARDTYESTKRELARRYPDDRRSYTHGKNAVIMRLLSEV